jgi:hypothetical protein
MGKNVTIFIKNYVPTYFNFSTDGIPKAVSFLCKGVSNETEFETFRFQLASLNFWNMNEGSRTKNPKMRNIRLLTVPIFIRCEWGRAVADAVE